MKVLWVVSQIVPAMAEHLGQKSSGFGGWVRAMLSELEKEESVTLGVVSCHPSVNRVEYFQKDNAEYWILPSMGRNRDVSPDDCKRIIEQFSPDLIHIEGTEWSISKRFSEQKSVTNLVSLQGILNGYEMYQFGDLPIAEFMFSFRLRKLIAGWTLFLRKKVLFDHRLKIEEETIKNADNLMGRTLWDRAHSYKFNRFAPYYKCNRNLRNTFYHHEWSYEKCNKHAIFVGNGYSALKGGHFVIEAVKLLIDEYPDIQLIFAGVDPYIHKMTEFKKYIGYSLYLRGLLKDPKLTGHVHYAGVQSETEMAEQLLKANVYVLPSIIENSPNTLGEAMIMGVPCVSAYTGGAGEMAIDEKEAFLFRAGDPVMMAWQIKRVFDLQESVTEMCRNAQEHARQTHSPQKNVKALLSAYCAICEGDKQ